MFENIKKFFNKKNKKEEKIASNSKNTAKERLHLVLMQDRANVSADFLELMKQEIIEVIKKYIDVDESAIDVRLTNKENEDGTNGAPALYANIPIINIKNESKNKVDSEKEVKEKDVKEEKENDNIKKEEKHVNENEEQENNVIIQEVENKLSTEINQEENKEVEENKDKDEEKEELVTNSKEKVNSNN